MVRHLLLDSHHGQTSFYLIDPDKDALIDYHWADDSSPSLVGAVFCARVIQKLPLLNGFSVDFGGLGHGFLPLHHDVSFVVGSYYLLVCVRDAMTTKPPSFRVLSAKRAELFSIPADSLALFDGMLNTKKSGLLYKPDIITQFLLNNEPVDRILTHGVPMLLQSLYPCTLQMVMSLWQRRVDLPMGAVCTIDETEALTAIDVDSSKALPRHRFDAINLAVADVIRHQLMLRRISGQIVIDFLSCSFATRKRLESIFLALPRCTILGFTAMGLLELRIARVIPSLKARTCLPDSSYQKSPRTIAYDIVRTVYGYRERFPFYRVRANPLVIQVLTTLASSLMILEEVCCSLDLYSIEGVNRG